MAHKARAGTGFLRLGGGPWSRAPHKRPLKGGSTERNSGAGPFRSLRYPLKTAEGSRTPEWWETCLNSTRAAPNTQLNGTQECSPRSLRSVGRMCGLIVPCFLQSTGPQDSYDFRNSPRGRGPHRPSLHSKLSRHVTCHAPAAGRGPCAGLRCQGRARISGLWHKQIPLRRPFQ